MKRLAVLGAFVSLVSLSWAEGEEPGHMHGPDGRHIVTAPAGGESGSFILSHHDMRIEGPDGKSITGAEVLSKITRATDAEKPIHTEKNVYEPENEVYGSHLTYTEPGEYLLAQEVKLPDGRNLKVEFPVYVPELAVVPAARDGDSGANPTLIAFAALAVVVGLAAAFLLGRKSAKSGAAAVLILALGASFVPLRAAAEEDEEGHMHGPDGRHIVTQEMAKGNGQPQLKAYPAPNQGEKATKTVDDIRFVLMIENEEMLPDPDLVSVSKAQAELIGLSTAKAETSSTSGGISTTGKVSANPNGVVIVNAPSSGKVVKLGALPGTSVLRGQLIAIIQSPDLGDAQSRHKLAQAAVGQAQAGVRISESEVQSAKSELRYAGQVLARQTRLAEAGEFASPTLEAAKSRAVREAAQLAQARIEVEKLSRQAERLRTGVVSGVVAQKDLDLAEADLKQAESRLSEGERQAKLSEEALEREAKISRQGIRTSKEVDSARSTMQQKELSLGIAERRLVQARASLRAAQAELSAAKDQIKLLGGTPSSGSLVSVYSPIDAEVEHRFVSLGQTLSEGEKLYDLLNADVVWVLADVFESDIPRVKVGQKVEVVAEAYPGQVHAGWIAFVHNEVNPETRTTPVRIEIRNPGERLKQNMFVQVSLGTDSQSSVAVPTSAVQKDKGLSVVFVEEKEGVFRKSVVRVKRTIGGRALVDGIAAGRKVATSGSFQLLSMAGGQ